MVDDVKARRITDKDWDKVQAHLKKEYDARKTSEFRRRAETKWTEVDRQLSMQPMQRMTTDGRAIEPGWHNVFELGELSKASEIITSDVMRITFPQDRRWFEPHVELEKQLDPETGAMTVPSDKQKIADGLLRSLMAQQHKDFGFKSRFRLSVKEALHHGGFVAEMRFDTEMMVKDGDKVRTVGAPVWVPHSMWNCYPDPSPSVINEGLFYTGSMFIDEFVPRWKMKKMAKAEGWFQHRLDKVPVESHKNGDVDTDDVKLSKYYGDLVIERKDGDIYLPNAKAILANGVIVFYDTNKLPFSPLIYRGYERQDVRDPYFTSPIIKQSPMQKFTTIMANRFADAIDLHTEPPVEYDGNDPDYIATGGPDISPGSKNPRKGGGKSFVTLEFGDPNAALEGMQFGFRQMQEGLGVSSMRAGVQSSDRQTATEVSKTAQGSEIRTVEFVTVLEPALSSWLYMQHELNRLDMKEYTFYSDEMKTPDYIRASNKDIQANALFDVVGARGLLGEEQRTQRVMGVTAFASGNPLFSPLLKADEILLDAYRDAGKRNPEDYVQIRKNGPSPEAQQMQQQMQEMQQAIQQKEQELKAVEEKLKKNAMDQGLKANKMQYEEQLLNLKKQMADYQINTDSRQHDMKKAQSEHNDESLEKQSEILEQTQAVAPIAQQMAESIAQNAQVMAGLAQLIAQGNQINAKVLEVLASPKKIGIQRDTTGRISSATATVQ